MRVRDRQLKFDPFIPEQWDSYSFKIGWRGFLLRILVTRDGVLVNNESNNVVSLTVYGESYTVNGGKRISIPVKAVQGYA